MRYTGRAQTWLRRHLCTTQGEEWYRSYQRERRRIGGAIALADTIERRKVAQSRVA